MSFSVSGRIVTPKGVLHGEVEIEDGKITNIRGEESQGDEGPLVIPGLVDIHNHGMGGTPDMLDYWTAPEYTTSRVVHNGVTSVLATVTFPREHTTRWKAVCDHLRGVVGVARPGCAIIEGIHAEGPIVADLGGLPPSSSDMSINEFNELLDLMPALKMMTISPSKESDGGYARIKSLVERGARVALGHDKSCTEKQIIGALRVCQDRGHRAHITHVCNVSNWHHRDISLVNFGHLDAFPNLPMYDGLATPTIEVIADHQHLHPLTLHAFFTARKPQDIAVVTDCVTERLPGRSFTYNGREMEVTEEGAAVIKGTPTLAGNSDVLFDGLLRLYSTHKLGIQNVVEMCCASPARIAGLDNVGSIEVGKDANLVVLNSSTATPCIDYVCVRGIPINSAY